MAISPKVYAKSKTIEFVSANLYGWAVGEAWQKQAKARIEFYQRQYRHKPNYLIFVCEDGDFRVKVAEYEKRWHDLRSMFEEQKNEAQDFEDIASHARAISGIAARRRDSGRTDVILPIKVPYGTREGSREGAVTGRTETVSSHTIRYTEVRPACSAVGKTYSGSPVNNPHPVKIEISNSQPLAASYRTGQLSMYVNGKWVGWVSENDVFGLSAHLLEVSSEMRVNREIKDAMTKRPVWSTSAPVMSEPIPKLYPHQEDALRYIWRQGFSKYGMSTPANPFRIEQQWYQGYPYLSIINTTTGEQVVALSIPEAVELSIALRRANVGNKTYLKGCFATLSFEEKRNLGVRLYYAVEAFRTHHGRAFG